MTRKPAAVLILTLFFLSSCVNAPPSDAILREAHYGDAPGSDHQSKIRKAFEPLLIEPGSAKFEFGEPMEGWGKDQQGFVFGWIVWTEVNSKNEFGAYAGASPYKVLLKNGDVDSIYEPAGNDLFGDPIFERLR